MTRNCHHAITPPHYDEALHPKKELYTVSSQYRIESSSPLAGRLLPPPGRNHLYGSRSLAIAVAVKSVADPSTQEVRVVHVPTGKVVFRTLGGVGHSS
jgi:hypothetical protein